jgi:GT2 family glycosyltransferase
MKACAIVILNYNGKKVLETFMPSVIQFSRYDIWVIDNASTDDSLDFLGRNYPGVSLVRLKANLGFTGGYNWGLEELRNQYTNFILLNSDVEVSDGWDVKLTDFLENNPDYACVQPKILSWINREIFDYAGAGGGFLDALGYPYCRGRLWNHLETDEGRYDDSIPVDWASGACMAIRAADFFEQNGFDAHFFAHMEEIDLCWRLRRAGKKIGYLGTATVFHQGGATLDRLSARKLYLNIRNSLSMIKKNVSFTTFLMVFAGKGILEGLACLGYALRGKWDFFRAIIDGYRDFFKTYHLYSSPEKKLFPTPVGSGPARLLFFHVMILGKRKFSQL